MQNGPDNPLDGSSDDSPDVTIVVMAPHQTRWGATIDDWNALTLLGCLSDDPGDWSDIGLLWSRYRSGPSAEFADSLPLIILDTESALSRLPDDRPWLVVDLRQKRVLSGGGFEAVPRDACFGLGPDDEFGRDVQMPVHLPPWWEIKNGAAPLDAAQTRSSAICRPDPRRDILWGPALADALAEGMLACYGTAEWKRAGAEDDPYARHPFTVRVHRDWLMTPRDDLGGRIPRESLHGGIEWLDRVIEGQQASVLLQQRTHPIPHELSSYADAPMGRSEVCMYFDACREMIERGWQWLVEHSDQDPRNEVSEGVRQLSDILQQIQREWMRSPFEEGSPPIAIIQCERDRIPQVVGVGEEGHIIDCNCPICQAMAGGLFGPSFYCFDGHHLEMDNEFAFSLWETREQWEIEQEENAEIAESIDAQIRESTESDEPAAALAGELASVWQSSYVADEGLPGDTFGHLALSFRLADMIGDLESQTSAQADIDLLNQAFGCYRQADHTDRGQRRIATERFKGVLEEMAQRHEFLISRAADLQSTLDARLRD